MANYISGHINKLGKKDLRAVAGHNQRIDPCAYADTSKTKNNVVMYGDVDIQQGVLQRIHDTGVEIKDGATKNNQSVVACEIVIQCSPEFFRENKFDYGVYDEKKTKLWAKDVTEFLKKKYGDNLIRVDLHLDEATPHIHGIFTPIIEKQRKKRMGKKQKEAGKKPEFYTVTTLHADSFNQKKHYHGLQDELAKEVGKKWGLERGIRGSRAKQQSLKEFWGNMSKALDEVPLITKGKRKGEPNVRKYFSAPRVKLKDKPTFLPFSKYKDNEESRVNKVFLEGLNNAYKKVESLLHRAKYFENAYKSEKARTDAISSALNEGEHVAEVVDRLLGESNLLKEEIEQLEKQHEKELINLSSEIDNIVESEVSQYKYADIDIKTENEQLKNKLEKMEKKVESYKLENSSLKKELRRSNNNNDFTM